MTDLLLKVALPSVSGLPEDDAVIDLVYTTPTAIGSITFNDLSADIAAFFNTPTSTTFAPAGYISPDVSRAAGACTINYYDLTGHLDGSPVGSPVATSSFNLGSAIVGQTGLPSEVAMVLSFSADTTDIPERQTNPTPPPTFIRPAARRRGRVFLGPLNEACLAGDNPARIRPGATFMTTIVESAQEQLGIAAAAETDAFVWSVWSRTDEVLRPVVETSVDNAFDTVRSRGVAATFRTTLPV